MSLHARIRALIAGRDADASGVDADGSSWRTARLVRIVDGFSASIPSPDGRTTRIEIGSGAVLGAGIRVELLGGTVEIGGHARIGEGVVIRPAGRIRIEPHCAIEDLALLESDASDGTNSLIVGARSTVGRGSRLWAHRGPLSVGAGCSIGHANHWIATGRGIEVADGCDFTHAVTLDSAGGSIALGKGSGVGPNSILYGHGGLRIGARCAIAGLVMIVPSNHRFDRPDVPIRDQGSDDRPIEIGDGVWIGGGAVVLAGARIGEGAVVGAGAVVRGEVAPRAIVAGVPARPIGARDAAARPSGSN